MKSIWMMAAVLVLFVPLAASQDSATYVDQTPEEVWGMIQRPGSIVVDVSPVWDQGHLPGAVGVPLAVLAETITEWDPVETFIVYCHTDAASMQGARTLVDAGFEHVYRMEGNFSAWVEDGFPVQIVDHYMDVTTEQAFDILEMNHSVFVIDVSPMYDEGHIPGAISAPLAELDSLVQYWDHQAPHLVYCHIDQASIQGAQILVDAGFDTVYRLKDNFGAWIEAGYPVDK